MNKEDVSAILALINTAKILGVGAGSILKDGKFNFADFPILLTLMSRGAVFVESFKNLPEAMVEVKDIDKDELVTLVTAGYAALLEIKEAFKA